jgi:hypothetical protein
MPEAASTYPKFADTIRLLHAHVVWSASLSQKFPDQASLPILPSSNLQLPFCWSTNKQYQASNSL